MRSKLLLCLLLWCVWHIPIAAEDYVRYVNTRIGTGGHGHTFLGANVPWGFVQLGPTQPTRGWDWCSGYHDSDSVLLGFGHQHLSGTGIGELGDITFLPVSSAEDRSTLFRHDCEQTMPGYYAVTLDRPQVQVELTATKRVGFHRYTFSASADSCRLLLNLRTGIGWDRKEAAVYRSVDARSLSGMRHSKGWAADQTTYFHAVFSRPVSIQSLSDDMCLISAANTGEPLLLKVGISAVDEAGAKANVEKELPGWEFESCVQTARKAWNEELAKISISTQDTDARTIFYTALYHTMIAPSVFCDVDGRYRGSDGKIHQGDFTNYTTLSLWDTYRAAHPLLTLIQPEMQKDLAQTFLHIFREQGKLPVWHLVGNETNCMVGSPGVPVLADMVLKGYVKDEKAALEALVASQMLDERGLDYMKRYGYLPYNQQKENETVAKGLEYALADDAVAKVAKRLGDKKQYRYFFERSRKAYRSYFDPVSKFMRAIDTEGKFRPYLDPIKVVHRQDDYTEGNAWQYTWLVPHDVPGLIDCFGGEKEFVTKLDSLFIVTGDLGKDASPDISGLIGQYAHGNEPSHHIAYLYTYAGQPWKTAKLLRRIYREMYRNAPDGLCGNEDVGAMSAWYILSTIGFYQVDPAGGRYVLGSPLFDSATLHVGKGKTFTVKALNNSQANCYIQSARLNGKKYDKSYIDFDDIMRGGTLELTMGSTPSEYGTKKRP